MDGATLMIVEMAPEPSAALPLRERCSEARMQVCHCCIKIELDDHLFSSNLGQRLVLVDQPSAELVGKAGGVRRGRLSFTLCFPLP